ncbi:MAG: DNA internalization-related competence protein ComEC/Rec2 [Planctomycetes bacterium]|nr:DNA internalization-related competence protein ComEC/Rec2 [Planctomycetota bacterium]
MAPRSALLLEECAVAAGGPCFRPRGRVRVLVPPGDLLIETGSRVRVTGSLIAATGPRNPGGADERRLRRRQGIAAVLGAASAAAIGVLAAPPPWSPFVLIDRARAAVLSLLGQSLSPRAAALSAALLLGFRESLDPALKDAVARTGTAHLLAISGLHIVILIGALRAVLGLLMRPLPADLLAVAAALFYAALAGAESPVLRAAVGCAVLFGGRCLGRRPRPFASLAFAATVILLLDPADLFRPGFQLSFAAVAALSLPGRREWTEALPRERGVWGRTRAALAVSLRAAIGTGPIVAHHFGTVAPLGPLFTVAVTPLFLAAFGACVLHGLFGLAGASMAALLAAPADALCALLATAFVAAREVPGAAFCIMRPGLLAASALTAAAFLALARRFAAAAVLLALALAWNQSARSKPAAHEAWTFDVGHGQAVLLRSPQGAVVLVDCGSRGAPDVGRRTILPALDALGVARIDLLVLSHADADHVNGAPHLLAARRVREVVLGCGAGGAAFSDLAAAAARNGVPCRTARRGDVLLDEGAGGLELRVLAPAGVRSDRSDNDGSLVLCARVAGRSILLPGDIQSAGIRDLLASGEDLAADVLLLPHHGNRDPWTGPLLHAAAPALAIASRADGFRDQTVPLLAQRSGAEMHSTASSGAVLVRIRSDSTMRAEGYLEDAD